MSEKEEVKRGISLDYTYMVLKEPCVNPFRGFVHGSNKFEHKKTGHPVSAFW